jgi:pilus assembly protein CpaB
MNVRRTTLLIAIVLAVGTGWLTLSYLSSLRPAPNQQRQVLVASQDIPARTTITSSMFHTETRDSKASQPDAISDPARATGALSLISIPSGSQITASDVGSNAELPLPVRLKHGMRAVSIPVDRVKGVAGLIQPGDRVDVIAVPPKDNNGVFPPAITILRGVRVLAIGATLEYASATPSPEDQNAATATLEVNPKQADILAYADVDATLRLALRSPLESIRSEPEERLVLNANSYGIGPAPVGTLPPPAAVPPVSAPIAPPPAVAAPQPAYNPVQVIVGDKYVDPSKAQ